MDNLVRLYKKMYFIRLAEEMIIENYCDDEMKTPMHMSMGSEAISAGVCEAIKDDDQIFGTYRSHAPYLSKTGDAKGFFAEMYGKKTGACEGKSGSMHLCNIEKGYVSSSAIVASNIPVAVGAAFANKMKNNGKKVVVFFGEGAMDEGGFWESINMASLWSLPILFVCEDNRVAVHTYSKFRQGYNDIMGILDNFKVISKSIMGIDVEEVYFTAKNILREMDIFEEPGFLKLSYFRYLEHVGINSDCAKDYRKNDSWNMDEVNDPVIEAKKKLKKRGFDVSFMEKAVSKQLQEALLFAKYSEFAPDNELYKDVYYG